MTTPDLVEMLAAVALLIVTAAHYEEIHQLPTVGPALLVTALLASAGTVVQVLMPDLGPQGLSARALLVCAQTASAMAAWHALRGQEEEAPDGLA
jgi:hypothetical protein